jgi:glycosyltransferase involved in cell wall biosynthesis
MAAFCQPVFLQAQPKPMDECKFHALDMLSDIPIQKRKGVQPGSLLFSILIPSWNNLEYLRLCINSIRKNSHYSHQIIVHINEGKDGTLEWVQSQEDIDFTYSEQNIGICYALNIGRSLVGTDYVVYLNDDMYVCPGWDLELSDEIKKIGHPYFFLSATAIEPLPTRNNCVTVANYGTDIQSFREEKLLAEFAILPTRDWQGATWPPNIVHRDLWDLAGGYSIEFSPGLYSDPDFSMKLWMLHVRLFKGVAKSRVYHFGGKSTFRVKKNRGYFIFIGKWGITASTLTKKYLRSGESFDGPLAQPRLSGWMKLKNFWKQLEAAFRRIHVN